MCLLNFPLKNVTFQWTFESKRSGLRFVRRTKKLSHYQVRTYMMPGGGLKLPTSDILSSVFSPPPRQLGGSSGSSPPPGIYSIESVIQFKIKKPLIISG